MPRPLVIALLLTVSLAAAGCTTDDGLTSGATTETERASKANEMLAAPPGSDVVPTGKVHDLSLYLHEMRGHSIFPGASMDMWGFSLSDDPATATIPGPTLRVTEGDTLRVTLMSTVAGFNHTLHWHGQNVPWGMDGVPFMTQAPVEQGESFTYEFVAKPAGTYWYHCHVDAQHHVDMGMYGVLIVDPADPAEDPAYDQEFVMVVDEMDRFHIESGTPAGGNTPTSLDPFAYEEWLRRQASDVANRNTAIRDAEDRAGVRPQRGPEYGYPITHQPYTATYNSYVINGVSYPYTEPLVVTEGKVARIRLVNAGNELFAMHLHGHHVLVTHKDGVLLDSPYWADVVPIAPGERYDLYVRLDNPGMWDFHDHIGGHTQNDDIFPGGAMTMLCYDSIEQCSADGGGHEHGGGTPRRSGELSGWTGHDLP